MEWCQDPRACWGLPSRKPLLCYDRWSAEKQTSCDGCRRALGALVGFGRIAQGCAPHMSRSCLSLPGTPPSCRSFPFPVLSQHRHAMLEIQLSQLLRVLLFLSCHSSPHVFSAVTAARKPTKLSQLPLTCAVTAPTCHASWSSPRACLQDPDRMPGVWGWFLRSRT